MKFKRKFFIIILFIITISWTKVSFATQPDVVSGSAILVEESTDKILYEKNAYEQMYPASTTKIMTAILTLENCDLDEMATISSNAIASIPNGYVTANIQAGEIMSVKDLMYALMLKSANDAAVVLAEHIAGSVESFSDLMNEKALELGCKNTHFVNPNGIHDDNHYSTAYDLYLIAKYCMQNQTFREYVNTTSYTLPSTNLHPTSDRVCVNTNDMLRSSSRYYNENVIGIKTGFTTEAKNCLISAALKNNVELISIILHAGTNNEGLSERYIDTEALFNYGFNEFGFNDITKENDTITNITVKNGDDNTKELDLVAKDTLSAYLNKDFDLSNIEPEIILNENIEAPISINSVIRNSYL